MLNMILNINKKFFQYTTYQITSRPFFKWLIIAFNSVDKNRIEEIGADQACAEWLLRNGAFVKWLGKEDYVFDYNLLPHKKSHLRLQSINSTKSGIHHSGFGYFSGCKHIEHIKLIESSYIENDALMLLSIIKDTLKDLEVKNCYNITDEGLLHLKQLKNLELLKLEGMPYVKNKSHILAELTTALPNCKITYN